MNRRSVVIALFLLLLLMTIVTSTAFAFDGRGGDLIEVKAGEIIKDDLYVSGNRIVIDGTIQGDLFIFGSDALINGVVEGDLFFMGRSLLLNGQVKDDVRLSGASFTLGAKGKIGGDFLAAGYSLETQAGSQIGGKMLFGAGQALLAGTVAGDVFAGVNGLQLEGSIQGNLNVTTANKGERLSFDPTQFFPNLPKIPVVAPGLTIGSNAKVGGALTYQSPAEQEFKAGDARIKGNVNFTADAAIEVQTAQQQLISAGQRALSRFLGALLVGMFLLWLLPGFMRKAATVLRGNLGGGVGWGLLNYLLLPIVLLLVLGLVIAISIGFSTVGLSWAIDGLVSAAIMTLFLIAVLFVFVIVLVGKIAAGVWLGRLLTGQRDPARGRLFAPMLLGLLIIALLIAIPYVGAIFNLIFSVLGVGAVWLALRGRTASTNRKPHPYALQS